MLQAEHSAILSTFIKLPFVIKIFVLAFFEWPLETAFTVCYEIAHLQVGTKELNDSMMEEDELKVYSIQEWILLV